MSGYPEPPLLLEVKAAAESPVWGPHSSLGAVTRGLAHRLPSHAGRLDAQVRMPP